jgi:hypothetical protein
MRGVNVPFWSKKNPQKSAVTSKFTAEELFAVSTQYVLQETVAPLKRVVKVLGFGAAGAVTFALGAIIALVGVLRLLQTETGSVFGGSWSFAPYLLTAVFGVAVVGVVARFLLSALRTPDARTDALVAE